MSGLSSQFSRPRKGKTNGATANSAARSMQTPDVYSFSETPSVVRRNVSFDDSALMSQSDFRVPQSRSRFEQDAGAPFTPAPSSSPRRLRGGQQSTRENPARQQNLTNVEPRTRAPVPCYTLRARLSLESNSI